MPVYLKSNSKTINLTLFFILFDLEFLPLREFHHHLV